MQEIHLTTREFVLYLALFGAAVGLVIGLIIFFFARRKGKRRLGLIGLLISIVAGAISPLLPLLVLVVFIFLIAKKAPLSSASVEPGDEPDDNGNSAL